MFRMGIDDVIREMKDDELSDRTVEQNKATPIDYARLRSRTTGKKMAPQKVYYAIRTGRLELEDCNCGRHVIDIDKADKLFNLHQEVESDEEVGATD
jgi:hypothetical protein